MTGEQFTELYRNKLLRNYIVRSCWGFSRNQVIQEDLLQEAWMRIGALPSGRNLHYYLREGCQAMAAAYMREWRHWNKGGFPDARCRKRLRDRMRYYMKKVS